jgi:integrase/recombinase XerC
MYIPITIKLTVLPSNLNDKGLVPISLQFTKGRKVNRISLRKWIPLDHWLNEGSTFVKEKGLDASNHAKELNMFLLSMLGRANQIILNYQMKDKSLSFSQFKKEFIKLKSKDFIQFVEQVLIDRSKSDEFSQKTLKHYRSQIRKLSRFRSKLVFEEITTTFLDDYKRYLKVELDNDVNTVFSSLKFIRTMLNLARKQKISDVYPFSDYKVEYKKDTRDRLFPDELQLLQKVYNDHTLADHLQNVLQYFLFACYTGLSWSDLERLEYTDIENRGDKYIIHKHRQKTDQLFIVPLMTQAQKFIDLDQKEGKVFPNMLSNQKANVNIKKIIASTRIKKNVSFHVARHTFGTVALNNGIPREVVQKMMGHAKSEQTDLYSKVLDNYVIDEMDKWDTINTPQQDFKKNLSPEVSQQYKKLRIQLITARISEGYSESIAAAQIGVSEEEYKRMERGELQFGLAHWVVLREWLGEGIVNGM